MGWNQGMAFINDVSGDIEYIFQLNAFSKLIRDLIGN